MLDVESSSSESSSDSDGNTYSSSEDIFPNDWTSNNKERSPFTFQLTTVLNLLFQIKVIQWNILKTTLMQR